MTARMFELTSSSHRANGRSVTVVDVGGEVDVTSTAAFTLAVKETAADRPVIVDLTRLGYIDSAGFAVLDRLLASNTVIIVLAPHGRIRGAADLIGLPLHDTIDDALRALDDGG